MVCFVVLLFGGFVVVSIRVLLGLLICMGFLPRADFWC